MDHKFQQLRKKAEELIKQKGIKKSEDYYDDIENLIEELNIHQIELEMQNQELQAANQKIISEQNRYKELYTNAPVAYFTLNQTGNIIELNKAAADLLKIPVQAFKYTSIFPYLGETSKNDFSKYFKKVFNSDKIEYGEIIFKNSNSELVHTNLSAVTYFDTELNEQLVRCSVVDKTLIKKYEHQISEQKKYNDLLTRYQTIISATNAGIGITQNDGIITECNPAFAKLLGYTQEEIIGKDVRQFNHPDDREVEFKKFQQITPDNPQLRIEKRYITKNNQTVWVDLIAQKIFNEQKQLEYTVGIAVDISERKASEEQSKKLNTELKHAIKKLNEVNEELKDTNLLVKAEQKQFLSILDSIPESIYVNDIHTHKILFANKHLKKEMGRNITGEVCFHALQENKKTCDFCPLKNIQNNDEPYYWEHYNPILDKHFYIMDRKIKWTNNQDVHFQMAVDITDRKKAEEKLTQINHRLEVSMNSGDMAWWEMELPSGNIIFNQNKALMLGRNPDDFKHYNDFMNLVHPNDYEPAMQAMHKLINGESDVYKTQYRIKNSDNQYVWFDDSGIISSKENGKILMTGIVRNINQQKIAEEKLKESLTLFDKLVNTIPVGVYISSMKKKGEFEFDYVSNRWCEIYKLNKQDVLADATIAINRVHPDDRATFMEKNIQSATQIKPFEWEGRFTLPNGDVRWSRLESVPYQDFEDVKWFGFAQDITDRKQVEQTLKESEENFKTIIENSSNVFYKHDVNHKLIYVSPQIKELMGYEQHEVKRLWTDFVTENFINKIAYDKTIKAIETGERQEVYDAELQHKNGNLIKVEIREAPVVKDGKTVEIVGAISDVTEKRKFEQKLRESEEKFKAISNSANDAIILINNKGEVIFWNRAAENIFEYTEAEVLGKNLHEILSPEKYREAQNKGFEIFKNSGHGNAIDKTTELEAVRKSGEVFSVEVSLSAIKIKDEWNAVGIVRDITDRKQAKQAILNRLHYEEKLAQFSSTLLLDAPDVINNSLKFLLEASNSSRVYIFENFVDEQQKLAIKQTHEVCAEGIEPQIDNPELQHLIYEDDGFGRWQKTFSENGIINGIVADFPTGEREILEPQDIKSLLAIPVFVHQKWFGFIGFDDTHTYKKWSDEDVDLLRTASEMLGLYIENHRNKQTIEKRNTELKKANRLKSEFLANMSHEIRTPMNAVIGFAEILNDKLADKPEYKSFIEGIVSGGKNLISLINDILDLSKIEAGRMEIKPEPINLRKLIEDIEQIFSAKIKKKNLEFRLNIDKRLPQSLLLDQTRIRQILFNLVGNAIKFTDKGAVSVSVKIEGDVHPESKIDLYFEVKDTGIGIPENQLERIFQAFQQTEGQSHKYGGTGLGLPITKRLTEAMNGTIQVESKLGEGSVFSIHFKSVVVPAVEREQKTNEQNLSPDKIVFHEPEILLVDDVESNREVIKYHLSQLNCRIVEAENGKEAIDFLKKNKPDLILMDIQMPVMDGDRAAQLIKKQKNLKSIPIIALTALAMKEQEEKYKSVFDDYLKKPIEVKDLVNSLIAFLPYTKTENATIKEEKADYVKEFASEIDKAGKLPEEFIQQYKTELLPLYEDVYDIMDINLAKEFAMKIIEKGVMFKIDVFVKYGTELKAIAETYKLSEMENLLESFKEFNKIVIA
jgi:PAS domain S-box-containing protein